MLLVPAPARAGELYDRFGATIVADGERVAVAAPFDNGAAFDGGAVDVFVLREGTWRFEQRVTPEEPLPFGHFGVELALAGDLLAAGVYPSSGQGWTHVFAREGEQWTEVARLTIASEDPDQSFSMVAVDDGWVAVGTPSLLRGGEALPGEIHLYQRTGAGVAERQVLTGEPGPRRRLGASFALAGGTLVVALDGAIETYVRAGDAWQPEATLAVTTGVELSRSAWAFDGATLMLVDEAEDRALFYRREGAGWSAPVAAPIDLPEESYYSGVAAFGGDWAAVTLGVGEFDRRVDLLRRDGDGWAPHSSLERDTPLEYFGSALAFAGGWLWVGEPGYLKEDTAGEVLTYRLSGAQWEPGPTFEGGGVGGDDGCEGCAIDGGEGPALALLGLAALRRRRRR